MSSSGLAAILSSRARTPPRSISWAKAVALRRPQEARATFERVLELDPGDAAAMRALARTYAELDHTQLAESMVERYAAAGDRDLEELKAYLARGEVAVQDSEDSLRNRLAENPNDFAALAGLVRSLLSRGELEEGRAQLRGYLERNPNEPEPWILLGQALHGGLGDPGEASTAFTGPRSSFPTTGPPCSERSTCFPPAPVPAGSNNVLKDTWEPAR